MSTFSEGDRVRDRISDATGTYEDSFMNQGTVRWDVPDEDGNSVSSIPLADLEPLTEEDRDAVAKHDITASK